mmetsp:Transcript_20501/g.48115  ORF Transcript_20501/g.48115 Transcript_20501/m.48115 type:complete len:254 (+) Transcript_20501:135-896(+)
MKHGIILRSNQVYTSSAIAVLLLFDESSVKFQRCRQQERNGQRQPGKKGRHPIAGLVLGGILNLLFFLFHVVFVRTVAQPKVDSDVLPGHAVSLEIDILHAHSQAEGAGRHHGALTPGIHVKRHDARLAASPFIGMIVCANVRHSGAGKGLRQDTIRSGIRRALKNIEAVVFDSGGVPVEGLGKAGIGVDPGGIQRPGRRPADHGQTRIEDSYRQGYVASEFVSRQKRGLRFLHQGLDLFRPCGDVRHHNTIL